MKTKCKNGYTVENWYDRHSRNSIVRTINTNGDQVGDADYSGNRLSAKFAKDQMIKMNGGKA
jgi:hypothetical protein